MSLGPRGQQGVSAHAEGVTGGQYGVLPGLEEACVPVTTWGDPVWEQGVSLHVTVCGDMGRSCVLPCRGGHVECHHVCVGTHRVQLCPQI